MGATAKCASGRKKNGSKPEWTSGIASGRSIAKTYWLSSFQIICWLFLARFVKCRCYFGQVVRYRLVQKTEITLRVTCSHGIVFRVPMTQAKKPFLTQATAKTNNSSSSHVKISLCILSPHDESVSYREYATIARARKSWSATLLVRDRLWCESRNRHPFTNLYSLHSVAVYSLGMCSIWFIYVMNFIIS